MTPILQLQNLTITHQKDLSTLLNDLSLVVNPGDKLAIIGEEGTGKSTLMQVLYQPDLVSTYASINGNVINHFHCPAYLPQSLPQEELELTVTDFLYQDADFDRLDFNRLYQLADDLDFPLADCEEKGQSVKNLSGGERLKLQLIKLLSYEPDLILLDEPSNDLDLETLQWLESFIRRSQETIIFISHDEQFLEATATAILQLELVKKRTQSKATYQPMTYKEYQIWRRETYEKQLQLANKEREEHADRLARIHRLHQSVEHQLRNTKNDVAGRLLAKKFKNIKSQEKRYDKEAATFTAIPDNDDIINIFFSDITPLPPRKVLLNWENDVLETGQVIDLRILGQDKLVFTGKNGIGKTHLLKKIHTHLSARADIKLGYMPQTYEECMDNQMTALAFLSQTSMEQEVRTLLASLKFTREEVSHPIGQLSGGQKAKLFFAKMVLEKANVLLLDEPTRNFSPTSQPEIRKLLQNFPGAIISVSHDRKFIEEVAEIRYELTSENLVR